MFNVQGNFTSEALTRPSNSQPTLTHEQSTRLLGQLMERSCVMPNGLPKLHVIADELNYSEVVDFIRAFAEAGEPGESAILEVQFNPETTNIREIAQTLQDFSFADYFIIEPLNLSVLAQPKRDAILEKIA